MLRVSFSTPKNPHTEYITFDVIDMLYPYNAIFGRGLLKTFEAALHSGYLYLKIPATFDDILVFASQQDARNIEKGSAPGHKDVHFLREEIEQYNTSTIHFKAEAPTEYKKAIEPKGEFKTDPLDLRVPNRTVCIGAEVSQQEPVELLAFPDKNSDIFAWSTSDLVGVYRDIIEHRLQVNPSVKPRSRSSAKCPKRKLKQ
jgi:hypothetical protein